MRTELLTKRNVEPNPIGGDIAMTPRPIEQDVAYASPGHMNGLPYQRWFVRRGRSGDGFGLDDPALDLRRVGCSERTLGRILELGRREVGLSNGPFRGPDSLDK